MKQSKFSGFISTIFVLWFIVSMVAMIYCSNANEFIMVALGGQFFLLFGLFIFWGAKQKIGIVIALVGLAILIGVGINAFGTEEIITFFNEKCLPLAGVSIFLIIGICMVAIPIYFENKKKKRCTIAVDAKCERLKESYRTIDSDGMHSCNSSIKIYSPVWSYYVGGKTYTYCDNCYSRTGYAKVGDIRTLYINPDNFNDVYSKKEFSVGIVLEIIGVMFIFGGSFFIYAVISSF